MSRLAGWRPALRMARRDARRSRGRSILVLVMIALPVLGVVAADVVIATADVSGAESLERRLGAADALITFEKGTSTVVQGFDPDTTLSTDSRGRATRHSLAAVAAVLGSDVRAVRWQRGWETQIRTEKGLAQAETSVLDLTDPLTEGLFVVEAGREPQAEDEVVVNRALAGRGFAAGDPIEVEGVGTYQVVGVGESASHRSAPILLGTDPALLGNGANRSRTWLVDAGPVTWEEVRALNAVGAVVVSRAVLEDPPPERELPPEVREWSTGPDDAVIAVAVLVVVMALIEVVLLAGPAFAVGARRQSRSLALLAATGGTPAQARRVVLASAVVLGSLGAALGVGLGLLTAWAALPVLQRFSDNWLGPYDVPWPHLAGIAGFGVLSAILAAVVPAWIASRQDVVAVLAGRRGDRKPSLRSPLLGVLTFGAGMAGAAYGATAPQNGELFIAGSAILAVLGMILLVPLVVVGLARVSRRLPLPVRYAVRDAARHRTRTVPAVAAVAATVAGVVALGIANASDTAQAEATYTPRLPMGQASLNAWGAGPAEWDRLAGALDRELPGAAVTRVLGVPTDIGDGGSRELRLRVPGVDYLLDGYTSVAGSSVLVSDGDLPSPVAAALTPADVSAAESGLAEGRAVVLTSREVDAEEVRIVVRDHPASPDGRVESSEPVRVPAVFVRVPGLAAPAEAVLPPEAVTLLGLESATVSLLVAGPVTTEQEQAVTEAVAVLTMDAGFYVERGFQAEDFSVIILLVLGALGGVLMLGGTLTATFLALADARPDLATLSAVGAAPRTRGGVAASYAVVVGLVGAVLGAAVGFVPGIAVTYPLTGSDWVQEIDPSLPDHFLDVPWLLVGSLVIALPLLTAVIVGLAARSRLPLVARLD